MPIKLDLDTTYGQKLIRLFARLLFSNEKHSLIELSKWLGCSKQTVGRMIDDITLSYSVQIEESFSGKRKYYQIRRTLGSIPPINLTKTELSLLQMCHAFTEHLLGDQLFDEASIALQKNQTYLAHDEFASTNRFSTILPGSIDYTDHRAIISKLIDAMEIKKVCRVRYKRILGNEAKVFYIKPMKIFSYRNTTYIHAKVAITPGEPYREPEFDPLLAIHRISELDITDVSFIPPDNYDFNKIFNENFGIIKDKTFEVVVELIGYSGRFVSERIWSPDQKILNKSNDTIEITFATSSEPELLSWVLSFGNEAKLLKPQWLKDKLKTILIDMQRNYTD